MKVKRRTPRTEMHFAAIVDKMTPFYKELAKEEGVEETVVDQSLSKFARLSSRVELNGKEELDFEFASLSDTPDQVKEKFVAYLDSEHLDQIEEIRREMRGEVATDPATAPTPPEDAEKN